jgi:hypothetical protein
VDLVNDSLLPRPHPPLAGTTDERRRGRRARIVSEKFEHALNPATDVGVHFFGSLAADGVSWIL